MAVSERHLTDRELLAFVAGETADIEQIERHLEECEQCSARLAGLPMTDDPFFAALKAEGRERDVVALFETLALERHSDVVIDHTQDITSDPRSSVRIHQPDFIDRYRVDSVLGEGGFGVVYLAHDEQLGRSVAIKVPHQHRMESSDLELYLDEARTVANLDHPHIVPVLDVGSQPEFPCYVVSRYIKGSDLQQRISQSVLRPLEAAELVAKLADALHYAHKRGLVHRDVKPGNVLIGEDGEPYLVDFGLALHDENIGRGPRHAGTPAYMSPEQARGEGHRVDGRSDIFSLGVVLYESLVGRRPFRGATQAEILERVIRFEPRPLRQYDETIPRELQRICFKALSKRASDRYSSAHDMAADLRYLKQRPAQESGSSADSIWPEAISSSSHDSFGKSQSRVLPKGLRSYDAHDADFFLELLPGPRDRYGLPDSLRFWKKRIEQLDATRTFSVGLIYGPSGCGKSSLVRAGLLPRLSPNISTVYLEATSTGVEEKILREIRRHCADLNNTLNLAETLAALRCGEGIPGDQKLVIVIDQFEQWLHTHGYENATPLARALRQCDGGRVQCVLMVRDDFWMAATRLMHELEVRLVEGENSAAVDLFSLRHAEAVLSAYGRAYGVLPEDRAEMTAEQKSFVEQAVGSLAQDGRVVCVRLALFAEMTKNLEWGAETLRQVGGARGVGVTFLEQTFGSPSSRPEYLHHEVAGRAVLNALLPARGADIRGQHLPIDHLLTVSGYAERQDEFRDLIRMLDRELRLITPTDENSDDSGQSEIAFVAGTAPKGMSYQLTHDYLVPSIREWSTRKRKETRRGRAELLLERWARLWNEKPESRRLPPWTDFITISMLTSKRQRTEPEQQMMSRAARFHGRRWAILSLILLCVWAALGPQLASLRRRQAASLVDNVEQAPEPLLLEAIGDLTGHRRYAVPILKQRAVGAEDPHHRSRAVLALADLGESDAEQLVGAISGAELGQCKRYVDRLRKTEQSIIAFLKQAAQESDAAGEWRNKARLAVVGLHFDDVSLAAEMCQPRDDPMQRTVFIDTFREWHGDLDGLYQTARSVNDASLKSGLCLAVGGLVFSEVSPQDRWVDLLTEWYESESDSGTHGAAGWALQKWGAPVPRLPATPDRQFDWYVTPAKGLTMVRVRAGKFRRIDRNRTESNSQWQTVRLTKDTWLCDREVTNKLFFEFLDDEDYPGIKPVMTPYAAGTVEEKLARSEVPRNLTWSFAASFCNWLSLQEGREPCYAFSYGKSRGVQPRHGLDDTFEAEWIEGTNGFRLPTEAEWEYACRAGTTTAFCCGDDPAFLSQYADYASKEVWPANVAQHRCNAWGFFDMHGGREEWCWDFFGEYGSRAVDDPRGPETGENHILRGGRHFNSQGFCHSGLRVSAAPYFANGHSLRVATDARN